MGAAHTGVFNYLNYSSWGDFEDFRLAGVTYCTNVVKSTY